MAGWRHVNGGGSHLLSSSCLSNKGVRRWLAWTKRGLDAGRRLSSQEAHVLADLIVQQLGDPGVTASPLSSR